MPAKTFKRRATKSKSARDLASSVKQAKDKQGKVITKPVSDKTLGKL